jgi:hypothetical protein
MSELKMTEVNSLITTFEECKCNTKYTIEKHGDGYALYYGRCIHKHGYNLVYLKEPACNCDFDHLENLLNIGAEEYSKTKINGYITK